MKVVEGVNQTLHKLMENHPEALILGEDILDPYGGAFKVTKDLSSVYPDRVMTTPISEAAIVGMSIGMSLRGMFPVVEIMFGDFLTLAMDQIVNHAAKLHMMYNGTVVTPMIIRTPMGGGRGYGPTHSQSLEKLLLGVPRVDVAALSLFHDPESLYFNAYKRKRPVILIENKLLYPMELILSDSRDFSIQIHDTESGYKDIVVRNYKSGDPDVAVATYGGVSRPLVTAMRKLAEEEIRIAAVLVGAISPLSPATLFLVHSQRCQSRRLLIIEEASIEFGWSSEVKASLPADGGTIDRLGAFNTIIPAARKLEEEVLVNDRKITKKILELMLK
jgi:pyruvate/2-oxoglutarate/acetoin dehydrogenase E1 component